MASAVACLICRCMVAAPRSRVNGPRQAHPSTGFYLGWVGNQLEETSELGLSNVKLETAEAEINQLMAELVSLTGNKEEQRGAKPTIKRASVQDKAISPPTVSKMTTDSRVLLRLLSCIIHAYICA